MECIKILTTLLEDVNAFLLYNFSRYGSKNCSLAVRSLSPINLLSNQWYFLRPAGFASGLRLADGSPALLHLSLSLLLHPALLSSQLSGETALGLEPHLGVLVLLCLGMGPLDPDGPILNPSVGGSCSSVLIR